jgi:ABC-type multidrug transport system fused ATPase/permease subunit
MSSSTNGHTIHAILAEFNSPDDILAAARKAREAGYRTLEAYTPFPVHGLHEELGLPRTKLPWIIFCGGLAGCVGGFLMQWWMQTVDYPLNIAGRPANIGTLPSWIVIMFECTILASALTTVFGMLALNGLPQPYHPVFDADNFKEASRSRFFLSIEAKDPQFDVEKVKGFLESLSPLSVSVVHERDE